MANPKSYSCELCKKVFTQKCDYTRHKIKKAPCISLEEMEQIAKAKQASIDSKSQLITAFQSCLNILRDGGEGITGEKALKNLSYLLILKIIEPYIGNEINIDDYEYDFAAHFDESVIEVNKNRLLTLVRFSKLSSEKEDNIPQLLKYLWDIILSVNPSTKNIFLKDKGFDIRYQATYKKLFNKLNSIDFLQFDYDIMGDAYEEMFQNIMTGKVLGQFFTPPKVKLMMVKLINPQIKDDGTIETCCDPTMGTGGFLKTYLFHILEQAKVKAIEPNWNFITTQGLYGKELEPDTYKYAVSNMLISSGHMFQHLGLGDSIREPITQKFDNVLANPPFGIKGLKYDDFESSLRDEYIPIKTDNAISLFIQAIIYMLKINGKCALVLPDGQDLFSKTNKTLVAVREYLMKTCDLKEIIYLPAGIFTYTSIKTCVFYFVKKREGTDVLKTNIKSSKSKKESREYDFSKTYQTSKVAFYDFNPYEGQGEGVKHLLVEVPIDKLVNNSYSLNYTEYVKDESVEDKYQEGIVVKTLGEVCNFLPKSKRPASYGNSEGKYPFFKSSIKINSYVDEADYKEESLIIGDGGEANINYGINFSTSDHCYILQNKNKSLFNLRYVYYYLFHNLDIMKLLYTGLAIKNISKTNIAGIKIPIPSLEKQQTIVAYLDYIYEKANKTSLTKIEELKQLNEFCLNNQKIFGENSVKTLGELFKLNGNGKTNSKDITNTGEYPFYKASCNNPSGTHNTFDFDGNEYLLIVKSGGSSSKPISDNYGIGKVFSVYGKCAANIAVFQLLPKTNDNFTYLYYYLKSIQNKIQELAKYCTNNGNIDMKELMELKIPVPSLEKQKEIVAYCDYNCNIIKQLENEIENNKELAEQFIKGIVKNVGVDTDVDGLEVEEGEEEE
jgi:type I restriction-modification system DNA methylase subunit/restriction endonuclease S subunit